MAQFHSKKRQYPPFANYTDDIITQPVMEYSGYVQPVVSTMVIFLFLAWFFAAIRFYVRLRMVKKVDWDDYFLLLTLVSYDLSQKKML